MVYTYAICVFPSETGGSLSLGAVCSELETVLSLKAMLTSGRHTLVAVTSISGVNCVITIKEH